MEAEVVYLTGAGRRRIEQRLAEQEAELASRTPADEGQPEAGDSADAATELAEADDRDLVRGLIERTRDLLSRARPVPQGADDGVVRLGSTVRVRDSEAPDGEPGETVYLFVDGAEAGVPPAPGDERGPAEPVAADSPVGAALMGHEIGSQVTVSTPNGTRTLTVLAVEPYRGG